LLKEEGDDENMKIMMKMIMCS